MEQVQEIEKNTMEYPQNLKGKTYYSDNRINKDMILDYLDEIFLRSEEKNDVYLDLIRHNNSNILEKERKDLFNKKLYMNYFNRDNREHSSSSEKWIGYVEDIKEETFTVRLFELYKDDTYEEAEFYIDEVSPDDKDLFKTGAIFYWSIGYEIRNGQRKSESIIRFKRSVEPINDLNNQAIDTSEDIINGLTWD